MRPNGLQLDTALSRMDGPSTSSSSVISSVLGSEPYPNQALFHPSSFSPGPIQNGLPLQPRYGPDEADKGHTRGIGSVSSMASSAGPDASLNGDQDRTSAMGGDLVGADQIRRKDGHGSVALD